MGLNRNQAIRDDKLGILGGYFGGIARFQGLTTETLKFLIENSYADPNDQQNSAPTTQEFLEFMEAHPGVTAHGYAVDQSRPDYRISIEGLQVDACNVIPELKDAFIMFCRHADEFSIDGDLYSWWD